MTRSVKAWLRRRAKAHLDFRERRRPEPREIVWILGHMRSGSTLLMHLLSSHSEILGAGERSTTYSSAADLRRLAVDAAYARRRLFRETTYVVDQINHNRFLASPDLLNRPEVKKIFLIREPKGALGSMAEVFGHHYGMTPRQAVDYYLDRLDALARYARQIDNESSALALIYRRLVTRPEPVLRRLESFLALWTPLSKTYRRFNFTGKRGDPSPRIASRQILAEREPRPIDLEPGLIEQANEAYSQCLSVLEECCGEPRKSEPPEAES